MGNPLFNSIMNNQMRNNDLISQFQNFKKNFSGNPKDVVQNLLNSGKMSQEQFNILRQQAEQLKNMFT